VQAKDSTIPFEVTFASVAPVAKKAKLDEPEEELGCFLAVPIIDWPSAPSFTANTVNELISNLPNHLMGPILVDTTESSENWDNMITDASDIPCSIVWHDGKMFIVELRSNGHDAAVHSFVEAMTAIKQLLPAAQRLQGRLSSPIVFHHLPPAQPAQTRPKPDSQWRLNEMPVLVLEVGWTQTWNQLLAKANDYLNLTNGDVKLVVLVKIFPGQGQPAYTPGIPQPAAVGPVTLPMQAAVASILHGQFFLSQIIHFGVGQANHAQPRLRLPFRRLYPQAAQAAVDNALGNNPQINLTDMRAETEQAFLGMVQTGEQGGSR
jgi:hypothetical protein